ncbi:hypothetical protein AAD018_012680 [Aestuariibius insulae]|uniref:hypothetical protein n=1 Tax=Aestuariibius insulae TaxID=2058287 RepID=UPI00345EA097
MRIFLTGLWLIVGTASAFGYTSTEGREYGLNCNRNGYVLTPNQPVIPSGTLYLGRSCDAFSDVLGEGEWVRGRAGFRIDFEDRAISFPQQALSCPQPRSYDTSCQLTRDGFSQ